MNFMGLNNVSDTAAAVPVDMALEYLVVSIGLGIILMMLAVWSSKKIGIKLASNSASSGETAMPSKLSKSMQSSYAELILTSANVLFLCFGMAGIMILVNNNLARAFAIGAAIAVIRFRIKFDNKGLASTLFFSVLVGMACGVGQVQTAIVMTLAYGVLQGIIIMLMGLGIQNKPQIQTQEMPTIQIMPTTSNMNN